MPITSLFHAALSAAAVGLLLATLRRAGPRAAGLAAAVPINSLPALFWLSFERGGAYATHAVLGSLWGTGLTVLLGAGFARVATVVHAGWAALVAWLAVTALAAVTWPLSTLPALAAVLALAAVVLGRAATPRLPAHVPERRSGARDGTLVAMATAGAMSLVVTELSRRSGPQFCGLVAAIPLIGTFATCAGYRQGGRARMLRVLGGYLDGMAAKAAFLAALGAGWALDGGAWAWAIGAVAAAATLFVTRAASPARASSSSPTRSTACRPSSPCSSRLWRSSAWRMSAVSLARRGRCARVASALPSSPPRAAWRHRRTR